MTKMAEIDLTDEELAALKEVIKTKLSHLKGNDKKTAIGILKKIKNRKEVVK